MTQNSPLPLIGITGNTGSGKTTAAAFLAERGGFVLNADLLAHEVIRPGNTAYEAVLSAFGHDILNEENEIDRQKLSLLVFNEPALLRKLEGIIHPAVCQKMYAAIADVNQQPGAYRFIVIDAPLLVEADLHTRCDSVWLLTASCATKESRIRQRDSLTPEAASRRLRNQREESSLMPYADVIIVNDGDKASFINAVADALEKVLTGAKT